MAKRRFLGYLKYEAVDKPLAGTPLRETVETLDIATSLLGSVRK